jgi:cytochrome c oxidase subunit 2
MIDWIGQKFSDAFLDFPKDASLYGYKTDVLNGWVHILMLVLFVCWGIFLIYVLVRFSSANNPKASYKGMKGKFSKYVEGGIIAFEIFLLFALAIPGYSDLKFKGIEDDKNNDVEIRVIAQQFQWNIHYPGEDGIFGQTYADSVNDGDQNFIGLSREGHGADDIITMNQLHIPKGKKVKIRLSSRDVIHSFALPEMRVKQDAIPGMEIPIYFTAIMSSDEYLEYLKKNDKVRYNNMLDKDQTTYDRFPKSDKDLFFRGYQISCAQLCGNSHYSMKGYMKVHEPDDFEDWLEEVETLFPLEEEEEW